MDGYFHCTPLPTNSQRFASKLNFYLYIYNLLKWYDLGLGVSWEFNPSRIGRNNPKTVNRALHLLQD